MRAQALTPAAALLLALAASVTASPPASAQTPLTEHTISMDEGTDRSADRSAGRPAASLAHVRWLAGHWAGRGLGATAEETWLPPAGGAMPGVFRLVRNGTVELYEMVVLEEEAGSLVLRLRHFDSDFVGWEAKDESVSFPLVRRDDSTLWFDGLTLERVGPDHMKIWVALQSREGEITEELFEYRRMVR